MHTYTHLHAHTTTTTTLPHHTFSPLLFPLTHPLLAFSLDTLKAMPGIGEKLSSGPMGMILNNMGGNSNSNSNNNSSANSTKNQLTVKDYDLQELRKLSQAVFFETISASYLHFVTKVTTHIPCQHTLWTPTYPETHTLSSYLRFVTKVTDYQHTLSTHSHRNASSPHMHFLIHTRTHTHLVTVVSSLVIVTY